MPNIPPKANRRWKNCFSPFLYRNRNAIERMFGRLKDFGRIATRYDRLAANFLAAVCLAATVSYEIRALDEKLHYGHSVLLKCALVRRDTESIAYSVNYSASQYINSKTHTKLTLLP